MEKIGMFWGSTTGNQEEAAKYLMDYMKSEGFEVDSFEVDFEITRYLHNLVPEHIDVFSSFSSSWWCQSTF